MNRSKLDPIWLLEDSSSHPEMTDLLSMARKILTASEEQAWQHVSDLVADWQVALHRFFANVADTENTTLKLDEVRQLNAINTRVIALAERHRDSITTQLKALKQGRKAVSAYCASHAKS